MVIKYVPFVGDSKRAMDEYTSEIFMGGQNTIVLHNTCEDSLLAAPIILDLVILAELCERIEIKRGIYLSTEIDNTFMAPLNAFYPHLFLSSIYEPISLPLSLSPSLMV